MANGEHYITDKEFYTYMGDFKTELMGEIRGVRRDFMTMEAGRLTKAEVKIKTLEAELSLLREAGVASLKTTTNQEWLMRFFWLVTGGIVTAIIAFLAK